MRSSATHSTGCPERDSAGENRPRASTGSNDRSPRIPPTHEQRGPDRSVSGRQLECIDHAPTPASHSRRHPTPIPWRRGRSLHRPPAQTARAQRDRRRAARTGRLVSHALSSSRARPRPNATLTSPSDSPSSTRSAWATRAYGTSRPSSSASASHDPRPPREHRAPRTRRRRARRAARGGRVRRRRDRDALDHRSARTSGPRRRARRTDPACDGQAAGHAPGRLHAGAERREADREPVAVGTVDRMWRPQDARRERTDRAASSIRLQHGPAKPV